MSDTAPFRHDKNVPAVYQAFVAAEGAVVAAGIDPRLMHLLKLRASQLNDCAFCVKMHSKEARDDGETNERLDRLTVWRHVADYTPAEKAALAWTEALTQLPTKVDLAPLRADLRAHYSEVEASALTALTAMINLWNRLGVSVH
ncbi:alkylhydroperoxidase [Caulobacter flavus]|jgi:AhpD family alkylhydroperoxidase|uniref:Alkylhydroperoxidase n=1 Tax=Caulobacter flavus TaxID=1679497 RepID=A0A2N5CN30_9CAUL|nr:carboxymuconolactone decarboxylase family protein [Caulobacter flavus]AYV46610.1 alkylhydroperoxidase [Caulobacter flavus]PLR07846.1 alkylhydroperoxidase [Caulobacter flavus]